MNRFKYNIDSAREYIQLKGYKLISTEYTSSQSPLSIQCPAGHLINPCFSEFKRKDRCNECSISKKPSLIEIQNFLSAKGFTLLSTEYINNYSKLDVLCNNGHTWGINWINIKKGNGCSQCYGNKRYTAQQVSDHLKTEGYILDDEYHGVDRKLKIICPNNHSYSVRYHDFLTKNSRCVSCSYQTSRAEKEVLSFVSQHYPSAKKVKFYEIQENCPKPYKNKEIDIYIPELKLAIEYCGLYWHSEASGPKLSGQHRDKLNWCRTAGVRLITIFEDEWLSRQEQVKNLLLSVMGIHTTKLGARKTTVRQISKVIAKEFINTYHIQHLSGAVEVAFGLFNNDDLVGVITGSKHHRSGNVSFVLQRLCFITNIQVVGGASKLFKALCGWAKEEGYDDIISWSDNRISEGNVYTKLGFSLKNEYGSDYSYVLDGSYNRRYSKQSMKKKPSERTLNKTETELRKDQGYYRIFDCGKKAWIYSLI